LSSGSKLAINACCAIRLSVSSLLNSLPSIAATGVSVPSMAALSTSMSSCFPAFGDRAGQPGDAVAVGEVERRDRRAAAGVVNAVLEFFEPPRCAR
jgi:hypothetical protein